VTDRRSLHGTVQPVCATRAAVRHLDTNLSQKQARARLSGGFRSGVKGSQQSQRSAATPFDVALLQHLQHPGQVRALPQRVVAAYGCFIEPQQACAVEDCAFQARHIDFPPISQLEGADVGVVECEKMGLHVRSGAGPRLRIAGCHVDLWPAVPDTAGMKPGCADVEACRLCLPPSCRVEATGRVGHRASIATHGVPLAACFKVLPAMDWRTGLACSMWTSRGRTAFRPALGRRTKAGWSKSKPTLSRRSGPGPGR